MSVIYDRDHLTSVSGELYGGHYTFDAVTVAGRGFVHTDDGSNSSGIGKNLRSGVARKQMLRGHNMGTGVNISW